MGSLILSFILTMTRSTFSGCHYSQDGYPLMGNVQF